MSKGKYSKNQGFNVRPLVLMLAVALLIGATVGGTLAWLTASTKDVVNTFTVGNINIELKEDDGEDTTDDIADDANVERDFKMVPGNIIDKKPLVTVKANSEKSWLFVKVTEGNNLTSFITYEVGDTNVVDNTETAEIEGGWTEYKPTNPAAPTGVKYYYRTVDATTADITFSIIGNKGAEGTGAFVADKVLVKSTVTKADMDGLMKTVGDELVVDTDKLPTLTFEAAAVQYDNLTEVAQAWAKLPAAFKP